MNKMSNERRWRWHKSVPVSYIQKSQLSNVQIPTHIQGIEKNSSVWEHKLRCNHFLQNSTFERLAAEPQTNRVWRPNSWRGSRGWSPGPKSAFWGPQFLFLWIFVNYSIFSAVRDFFPLWAALPCSRGFRCPVHVCGNVLCTCISRLTKVTLYSVEVNERGTPRYVGLSNNLYRYTFSFA